MRRTFKNLIVRILNQKSRKILARHRPNIFLVIGSEYRNVFKDALAQKLKERGESVRVSGPGMNYKLGVPLTILNEEAGFTSPWKWIRLLFNSTTEKTIQKQVILEFVYGQKNDFNYLLSLNPKAIIITDYKAVKDYTPLTHEEIKNEYLKLIDNKPEEIRLFMPLENAPGFSGIQNEKTTLYGESQKADIWIKSREDSSDHQKYSYQFEGGTFNKTLNKFGIQNIYADILANLIVKSL